MLFAVAELFVIFMRGVACDNYRINENMMMTMIMTTELLL